MNFLVCFCVRIWKLNITPTHTKVIKTFLKTRKNEIKNTWKNTKGNLCFKKEKNQG
jgi:hypothetical protein